jgi:alpha-mannosidase
VLTQGRGHSLGLLSPGFFEYEADGPSLLLTLLRAVGQLSRDDLPTRPGHAGWPTPTPEAQCLGRERLQFGIVCLSADARPAEMARLWEDLFLPPAALWVRQSLGLDPARLDLRLLGEDLVFSALKPAEGEGVVLRCYNPGDRAAVGAVAFGTQVGKVMRVAADERELGELPLAPDGRSVSLSLAAGEILSLRIVAG